MVEVIGLNKVEEFLHQRASRLIEITKKEIDFKSINGITFPNGFTIHFPDGDSIRIYLQSSDGNKIVLDTPAHFEEAIILAQAFEQAGEHEFTIKKRYDEV